jgi:TubC N-terminal docking domain
VTADLLVANFVARGVILWAEGGRIEIDAPLGELTDTDLDTLRQHKTELLAELAAQRNVVPADWPVLSAKRWGPSSDDPSPGLVIDQPDPIRRRQALEALGTGPGDAYEGNLPSGEISPQGETESLDGLLAEIQSAGFIEIDLARR